MQSIADPAVILQHPQFQAETPFFARRLRLARLGVNADARWACCVYLPRGSYPLPVLHRWWRSTAGAHEPRPHPHRRPP